MTRAIVIKDVEEDVTERTGRRGSDDAEDVIHPLRLHHLVQVLSLRLSLRLLGAFGES